MPRGARKRRRAFGARTRGPIRKRQRRPFIGPRPFMGPRRLARTGGFTGIERKFFDTEINAQALATDWAATEPATTNLTAIGQGDGESERDGRKYIIDSIHVKGFFHTAAVEAQLNPHDDLTWRFCLVIDKQTNGAQLTATDVMDGGATADVNAFRNLQFTKRFIVLKDIKMMLSRNTQTSEALNSFSAGSQIKNFHWNVNFPGGMAVTMSGPTANIANVTDNSIHIIGVTTSALVLVTYTCRVRFRG